MTRSSSEKPDRSGGQGAASEGLRDIVLLAVPQLGLMLCHMGMSLTDVTICGLISPLAQASRGMVGQLFTLLMLLASLVGSGCLAAVSQALGMGLERRAARYAGMIVALALSVGLLIAVLTLAALPHVLNFMNVAAQMRPVAACFVTAYCFQLPFYYALIMLNSVFRAYRMVVMPFITMLGVALLNLAGSALFGLGLFGLPDLGYAGVAWTTFVSSLFGFFWNVGAAVRHGILCRQSLPELRWARRAAPYLFRVGSASALGNVAGHSGNLLVYSSFRSSRRRRLTACRADAGYDGGKCAVVSICSAGYEYGHSERPYDGRKTRFPPEGTGGKGCADSLLSGSWSCRSDIRCKTGYRGTFVVPTGNGEYACAVSGLFLYFSACPLRLYDGARYIFRRRGHSSELYGELPVHLGLLCTFGLFTDAVF